MKEHFEHWHVGTHSMGIRQIRWNKCQHQKSYVLPCACINQAINESWSLPCILVAPVRWRISIYYFCNMSMCCGYVIFIIHWFHSCLWNLILNLHRKSASCGSRIGTRDIIKAGVPTLALQCQPFSSHSMLETVPSSLIILKIVLHICVIQPPSHVKSMHDRQR